MSSALAGFDPVVTLMDRIADSGNKFPRVRLAFADQPLIFKRAGERSRYPGSVTLTGAGGFGVAPYYGAITRDGTFIPSGDARRLDSAQKAEMWAILKRLKSGEARDVFAEYGKEFGICCMCGRDLTNPELVAAGIGPICAEKGFG